ncbi:hypothetical protein ACHHYP_01363 [Achlya hypogyna]|uniref:TOG domain-containing protein n=1 Tax=Achlya hypogyna TaxID=1202772 RepID=A0A1V9ZTJ1_ACHHY|nr:hypothetical protein ACHHYP_01363 [Achlya hypogyna]
MERVLSALRSTETKTRLMGVTYVETFLEEDGWEEILTALVGCLSDNNAKVTQGSLRMLAKLIASPNKPADHIRGFFTLLWGPLKEKLGDSKAPTREAATFVLLELIEKIGMASVMDRLRLCTSHKNWRIREQVLVCIRMTMERFRDDPQLICQDGLLEMALQLLEDSSKDVREASLHVIHSLYVIRGQSLLLELQSKNLRPTHMRMLMSRLNDKESPDANHTITESIAPKRPHSAIRAPSLSLPSGSVSALSPAKAKRSVSFSPPRPASVVPVCAYSDKEVQQQMTIVTDGLAEHQEWTTRVKSLQHLQSLVEKGATQSSVFATALKVMRDRIADQVGDLRSTVTREACSAITALARAMGDAFHPFVEGFLVVLFKSVCVTIQVVSVSADTCVQNIIKSTVVGYSKAIPKFIEGARSKSQVIRLHCVEYLTLAWKTWDSAAFDRHVETMAVLLPSIIGDAQADVRAAARKCFWAFHTVHPHRANQVLDDLDAATKRRVVGEMTTTPGPAPSSARPPPRKSILDTSAPMPTTAKTAHPPAASAPVAIGPRRVFNGADSDLPTASAQLAVGPLRVPVPVRKQSVRTDDRMEDQAAKKPTSGALRVLNPLAVPAPSRSGDTVAAPVYGGALRVEVPTAPSRAETSRRRAADDNQLDERHNAVPSDLWEKRADDAMWSVRLETVDYLARLVPGAAAPDAAKIARVATSRLTDSHFRVAQSAMRLLALLIPLHPVAVAPHLKGALPKVLAKLVDPKEGVREQAAIVLEAIVSSSALYDASVVLAWVVPSMLEGPVKVKLLVYNFVLQLLPNAAEFCGSPAALRSLVLKLADSIEFDHVAERGTLTVVTNVLEKICELYDASFSMVLQQLSPSKLGLIQKCINIQASKLKRKHEMPGPLLSPERSSNQPPELLTNDDWLQLLAANNASMEEKLVIVDKMTHELDARGAQALGAAIEWPRLVLVLLDLALENQSNECKVVQTRVMKALQIALGTPEYRAAASGSVEPLILQLLSRTSQCSVLGLYFVEKVVTLVLSTVPATQSIRLLVALVKSTLHESLQVQIGLKALRAAIDAISSYDALHPGEFDLMTTAVIQTLQHANSVVRKNGVNCLVALYFLGGPHFVRHLQSLQPQYQKLVSLYIEKEQTRRGDPQR